jgi:hypothetical protein
MGMMIGVKGQTIDHIGDFRAEYTLHILDGVVGILDYIMKQCGYYRFYTQTNLVNDYFGYGNRMQKVRLSGTAPYPLVCLLRQEKGTFYEISILFVLANL